MIELCLAKAGIVIVANNTQVDTWAYGEYDKYFRSRHVLSFNPGKGRLQSCLVKLCDYKAENSTLLYFVLNDPIVTNSALLLTKQKHMVFFRCKSSQNTLHAPQGYRIKCIECIQYLGFRISFDTKINAIMLERKEKLVKMANTLLRALKTSCNVTTKLWMSLFDKCVSPVFMCGCSLWGIANAVDLLYLDDQIEDGDTQVSLTNVLKICCGHSLSFTSARRVRKIGTNSTRRILINSKNLQVMESILQQSSPLFLTPMNRMQSWRNYIYIIVNARWR